MTITNLLLIGIAIELWVIGSTILEGIKCVGELINGLKDIADKERLMR